MLPFSKPILEHQNILNTGVRRESFFDDIGVFNGYIYIYQFGYCKLNNAILREVEAVNVGVSVGSAFANLVESCSFDISPRTSAIMRRYILL